ncbi:diaminopimelate decarboxylase [Sporichthya sp.]|uniref:diaminopimelate decarboxylase n=1 Tax=Sporichthya sp. TaxID=65475 RepID=UPI0018558930|nr:diaminopimelate decarboxylase [Sporichthya sp.]MBA3744743.1 diaminopimelate decarboxylase [Sporichthya sp.]
MSRSAHPAGPRHADVMHADGVAPPPHDLNALDPMVWPTNFTRREDGVCTMAGLDVRDLAAEYGTPTFLLDEADFRSRARGYAEAFAGADVFYAGKAFLCGAVARWVNEEGLHLDVCSAGELAVALRAGFPAERIALHGNNKSVAELDMALEAGVGRIVLDSYAEIVRLADLARARGVRARVQIRVTVGVEAHTHEFIATAHEDQKFGFSLAGGAAAEAVRRVLMLASLELVGLHSHIGSQIFDTDGFEVAASRLVGLATAIRDEHGVELPELDLGGGLGIAYTSDDDPADIASMAKSLIAIVERACAGAGLAVPRLSVEPGRAIAGPGTVTLYEVGTVKAVALAGGATRAYVSVDGGMSDNIRTALYDASYTAALVSRSSEAAPALSRLVGKHCESGDIVVRGLYLPADIAAGDLVAVAATGAYCRSMASNYNLLGRPPVVAIAQGAARVIVRRETEDDLARLDVG